MATFAIGKIRNYDDGFETWKDYAEHLQQYYLSNVVANDKKVQALPSQVGPKTYALVKTFVHPEKPSIQTLKDLIEYLNWHLKPKTLVAELSGFSSETKSKV